MHRWLVVGHYGGHNTGDDAMLTGLISGFSSTPGHEFVVATKTGEFSADIPSEGARAIKASVPRVFVELIRSTGLLLGGGTHFHDDYAQHRYRRHMVYMLRLAFLTSIAKLLRKRTLWLGVGIGPLKRPTARWITRMGLKACDAITVRDASSANEVRRLVAGADVIKSFDLAALIPPASVQPEREPVLGVSVLSVSSTGWAEEDKCREVQTALAEALSSVLLTRPEIEVRVFGIRGGDREDDGQVSRDLIAALRASGVDRVRWMPYNESPVRTLREFERCRWFIAMRYHAGVFGYLAGCQLLLLAYHRKVADLAMEIGVDEQALVDLRSNHGRDLLMSRVHLLVEHHGTGSAVLTADEARQRARASIELC